MVVIVVMEPPPGCPAKRCHVVGPALTVRSRADPARRSNRAAIHAARLLGSLGTSRGEMGQRWTSASPPTTAIQRPVRRERPPDRRRARVAAPPPAPAAGHPRAAPCDRACAEAGHAPSGANASREDGRAVAAEHARRKVAGSTRTTRPSPSPTASQRAPRASASVGELPDVRTSPRTSPAATRPTVAPSRSSLADQSVRPSGENARLVTRSPWPRSSAAGPAPRSHMRISLSPPAEARRRASGENASSRTCRCDPRGSGPRRSPDPRAARSRHRRRGRGAGRPGRTPPSTPCRGGRRGRRGEERARGEGGAAAQAADREPDRRVEARRG